MKRSRIRLRRPRSIVATLVALVIGLLTALESSSVPPTKDEARVLSVTDGDTIVVELGRSKERVRLIGIDTPESKMNRRTATQAARERLDARTIVALGLQASAHTKSLLPLGSVVRLEFDAERRDRYQRLLAYVWLPNGTMANEEIIRSGYAYPLTIPPNVKYQDRFARAFREARERNRGLWAPETGSPSR